MKTATLSREYAVYDDGQGETAKVYTKSDGSFYLDANSYDKQFANKAECDAYLKRGGYTLVGYDHD